MRSYGIIIDKERQKAIIKYKSYRISKGMIIPIGLGIVSFILLLFIDPYKDGRYVWVSLVSSMLLFFIVYRLCKRFVRWKNFKLGEKIIFSILDRSLKSNEAKYPSVCKVLNKKIIKESFKNDENAFNQETVVVSFINGEVCEYPVIIISQEDGNNVELELSLTQLVCYDEWKISKVRKILAKGFFCDWWKDKKIEIEVFCTILFGLFVVSLVGFISSNEEGFLKLLKFLFCFLLYGFVVSLINRHKAKFVRYKPLSLIAQILCIPNSIILYLYNTIRPTIDLILLTFWVMLFTSLPIFTMLVVIDQICNLGLTLSLICFITVIGTSFTMVYIPSLIRKLIDFYVGMANMMEGALDNESVAILRNTYDPQIVYFLINVAYIGLVIVLCVIQFQHSGHLISTDLDSALKNGFVIFLSIEGIRNLYKKINLSSKVSFNKLANAIHTHNIATHNIAP